MITLFRGRGRSHKLPETSALIGWIGALLGPSKVSEPSGGILYLSRENQFLSLMNPNVDSPPRASSDSTQVSNHTLITAHALNSPAPSQSSCDLSINIPSLGKKEKWGKEEMMTKREAGRN
jgi:hypothetical protein